MVRLAEGLDRSHAQALSGLDLFPRSDDYMARLRASGDAELELWAAHRHVAPLEEVLGKPVRFEVAANNYPEQGHAGGDIKGFEAHAEQPDHATRVPGKAVRGRRHRRVRQNNAAGTAGEVA
jgi:hypothetical protein